MTHQRADEDVPAEIQNAKGKNANKGKSSGFVVFEFCIWHFASRLPTFSATA
jgi:hypothetical protein